VGGRLQRARTQRSMRTLKLKRRGVRVWIVEHSKKPNTKQRRREKRFAKKKKGKKSDWRSCEQKRGKYCRKGTYGLCIIEASAELGPTNYPLEKKNRVRIRIR